MIISVRPQLFDTYIHTWSKVRERKRERRKKKFAFNLGVGVDGGGYCLGSRNKYNPRFQWSHVVQEPSQLAYFSNPNVRCQFFCWRLMVVDATALHEL